MRVFAIAAFTFSMVSGFSVVTNKNHKQGSAVSVGLSEGGNEAFSASGQERSALDADKREMTQRLQEALGTWQIKVPSDFVEQLKGKKEWIRLTQRVIEMEKTIKLNDLYEFFNFDHHLSSAVDLFTSLGLRRRPIAIVYGHKNQGKSQFLFFLVQCLKELGEVVLYLDKTILPGRLRQKYHAILPSPLTEEYDAQIAEFWNTPGLSDDCNKALDSYRETKTSRDFCEFMISLQDFASKGNRVWVIVDEVVEFAKTDFPIDLPEEQALSPFYWIVTGSAGIGSWVAKRHLGKFIFDLPLFSKDETVDFATKFITHLKIGDRIDFVTPEELPEWLEERFGGVIGYTAELLFALAEKNSVSDYMTDLSTRIGRIISNTAKVSSISIDQLAKDWLNEITSELNTWECVRDSGLCGSSAPRGAIFSMVLQWLTIYYPGEDSLFLVRQFRSQFSDDPGLDGCLLELEEILKLKRGLQFEAALLELEGTNWSSKRSILVPEENKTPIGLLRYTTDEKIVVDRASGGKKEWYFVSLGSCFDVIDTVLVDCRPASFTIYGIQITRSKDPFKGHNTFETCSVKSKGRLEKLWHAIREFVHVVKAPKKLFVMIAPNCEGNNYRARADHEGSYLFSPANVVLNYKPAKKRRSYPTKARPQRKKITEAEVDPPPTKPPKQRKAMEETGGDTKKKMNKMGANTPPTKPPKQGTKKNKTEGDPPPVQV